MKTERKNVTSGGLGMTDAFAMTETLGVESGLTEKDLIHLRLMVEELFGALRSVAGDVEAEYWLEIKDKQFEIHMDAEVAVTDEMREQILSMSSSGENDAAKGFTGRLRVMIAEALMTRSAKSSMGSGLMLSMMSMASPSAQNAGSYQWSLKEYKEAAARKDAVEWDGLERSIIANIADDVSVRIVGDKVSIILYKQFG